MEASDRLHFPATLPPIPTGLEAEWAPEPLLKTWRQFLTLPGLELRPLGRPPGSQSLHRLRFPGSYIITDSIFISGCKIQCFAKAMEDYTNDMIKSVNILTQKMITDKVQSVKAVDLETLSTFKINVRSGILTAVTVNNMVPRVASPCSSKIHTSSWRCS
jgi:hypothetical protein